MNLLDQIIESGTTNTPRPLASFLRQCIVLSSQLKVPILRTWAENELNGYEKGENLPDYRKFGAGACGEFEGYGRRYPAPLIAPAALESNHALRAKEVYLFDPVATYEGIDPDGLLRNVLAGGHDRLLSNETTPRTGSPECVAGHFTFIRCRKCWIPSGLVC